MVHVVELDDRAGRLREAVDLEQGQPNVRSAAFSTGVVMGEAP